ncbi:TonB-dependent receptor plug domain-containing protein [Methylocucumis oryzae]|uniref:TonB-dependent receptor plug domain-containing protein n=1 Tax=Methylocucumis oryzae TaxID=1632867 RepID=UPI001EF9CE61|nr:TonB-dependent receptor plug domain-containing protein [Methylocucumis oryzae]
MARSFVMLRRISGLLIGVVFWFNPMACAWAETTEDLTDLPIEELLNIEILNASRSGRDASTAPASVSVLTANDIRAFGWRTLAEAMNAIRGIFSVNDRNYTYLGVRGFWHSNDYNSRILLAIDGQRMNDNAFDGSYYGQEFLLDMDLIERIEFIPGSGSSVYGANAFLGMINVVTKNGQALSGVQVSGEAGSYDSYKGRFSFGKKLANDVDVLLSGSYFDSAGVPNLYFREFDSPETNNGIAHNLDSESAQRLLARVQYHDLTLTAGYVDRFKQVPTAAYNAIFNDPGFFTVDKRFFYYS